MKMHAKKEHINGGFLLSVSIKILNIALLSGISMICAKNPKGSFVLFIILVFYNASGLLIFINLDVFAWTSLAMHFGAITMLSLLMVMMLKHHEKR